MELDEATAPVTDEATMMLVALCRLNKLETDVVGLTSEARLLATTLRRLRPRP